MTANPFAILATACHYLRLKPRERLVLRNCLWARTVVPNGHFLTPPNTVASCKRLVACGYLTIAPKQMKPFDPKGLGLVVLLEQKDIDKLVADAKEAARLNPGE